jgi:hypothetical protein
MWKVGEKNTMLVACNPESNFPISIEFLFGGPRVGKRLENSQGMWFGVEDARYLIDELYKAIDAVNRHDISVLVDKAMSDKAEDSDPFAESELSNDEMSDDPA